MDPVTLIIGFIVLRMLTAKSTNPPKAYAYKEDLLNPMTPIEKLQYSYLAAQGGAAFSDPVKVKAARDRAYAEYKSPSQLIV